MIFCGVFSFLFMYIFLPFNINKWYEGQDISLVQVLLIFTLCGLTAMGISQFGLYKLRCRLHFTNSTYICWFLGELALIAAIVTLVDVCISPNFFLSWQEYTHTLQYTSLIVALPYCVALLWFYKEEKCARLRDLESAIPEEKEQAQEQHLLLRDEHGKPVLTLHPAKLLMVKAEDNYVHVYYLAGSSLKKELIRTALKKVEADIAGFGFARSHRSYLVNIGKVVFFRKHTKGHYLHIEGLDDMEVPVSGSYLPVFIERFAPAC